MAGFIANLAKGLRRLELYVEAGIYGTRISPLPARRKVNLMTLADYVLMRPGDLVFFFQERRIYGVGRVADLGIGGKHAVLCNFPRSYILQEKPRAPFLWEGDNDPSIRWRVLFEPSPAFFREGVDMDEVLQSDVAGVARALPVFWNRSFLNLESDEANLIAHAILRRNQLNANPSLLFPDGSQATRTSVSARTHLNFIIDLDALVAHYSHGSLVSNEAALHAWLAGNLAARAPALAPIFGVWDYVCNLYPASPIKPRDYMDEMDIFGYSLAPGAGGIAQYVRTFRIIEVKADLQTYGIGNVVDQVMKYVDWVSNTRAGGDYGLVEAYIVATDFDDDLVEYARQHAVRSYVIPRRPYATSEWRNLKLVKYSLTGSQPALTFSVL